MHSDYKCDSIRELRDQQVRFAPREKKIEQVDCAEILLREIQVDRDYNFEFVCFRITGFRPENTPIVKINGGNLRSDLHSFIEDLSESASVAPMNLGNQFIQLKTSPSDSTFQPRRFRAGDSRGWSAESSFLVAVASELAFSIPASTIFPKIIGTK